MESHPEVNKTNTHTLLACLVTKFKLTFPSAMVLPVATTDRKDVTELIVECGRGREDATSTG